MEEKQTEPDAGTTVSGINSVSPPSTDTPPGISDNIPSNDTHSSDGQTISWMASEFMDHDKSASWYIGLAVVAAVASVAFYALFRDLMTSAVILVAAAALGTFAHRKPRQLQYQLDTHGLSIGEKSFHYDSFRSFSVIDEGHFTSIAFLPIKRFGVLITLYFDPQDEDKIVDLLGQHLPYEPRETAAIDRLMSRIRF